MNKPHSATLYKVSFVCLALLTTLIASFSGCDDTEPAYADLPKGEYQSYDRPKRPRR